MCGIHGFTWNDPAAMSLMMAESQHRGPDGSGIWSNDSITLGHNLLSIMDEPAVSNQPWIVHGRVLVYNGEIYNYRQLRAGLNHQFKTDTDTEVLMVGLMQQGTSFLDQCDGMFALAFYDPTRQELVLARDENGAKPLYYGNINGGLVFSSEIKSLLQLGFDRRVDHTGFKLYFYNGHTTGPVTMFRGISRLVPGEIRTIKLGHNLQVTSRNINVRAANLPNPLSSTVGINELLRSALKDGVSRTLMGRRQIGLFLSAGLDSSSILEEMLASGMASPRTYTTRFDIQHPKSRHNEDSDLAAMNAHRLGVPNMQIEMTEDSWLRFLEPTVLAMEEPRKSFSTPAYYVTNRMIANDGTVVTLSGDGGDELLAGYKHHRVPDWSNRFLTFRGGHREIKDPLLQMSVQDMVDYQRGWIPQQALTGDKLNDFMLIECMSNLSEDFLIRNDKLGMIFSMEARFPMLSRAFKDVVRGIPGYDKTHVAFHNGSGYLTHNKILLRNAYKGIMPDDIVDRAKTGWRVPTEEWIIGDRAQPAPDSGMVRNYVRDILHNQEIMDIFSYDESYIDSHYLNNRDFDPRDPTRRRADGSIKGAHIGLASHKELSLVVMFALWYRLFNMKM